MPFQYNLAWYPPKQGVEKQKTMLVGGMVYVYTNPPANQHFFDGKLPIWFDDLPRKKMVNCHSWRAIPIYITILGG